ncbi:hypothetical protein CDL15_Pgr019298 [Punica granatum]|uniref:PRP1 splicing factor N-terminal domain-containing protein n=1 Tax=Punica granatum TaxID=22663 RepID=A0A218XRU8_PUNGR|nr:hypothetical protein CDL15_Pgr019298 [Punica granatum]
MAALIGNQNRENPNPNPNPNPDQEEYGEESKGERYFANIFIEEGPSDDAFFLAGGNGEPEFDEDDYDEDDKEADAVWEAIDEMMDSQRKDRREARLKQEIEKYCASNQHIAISSTIEDILDEEIFNAKKDAWMLTVRFSEVI